ncbi:hypothetical protein BGX33_003021 [Mortierella sp. NVP41]|nr:hypothetical protein BGX33_003021 [Mortierella sp. NVP41]
MTPGEEKMVFDKGLLYGSHRPSTRSDPTNTMYSEPLPEFPPMMGNNRSSSDPEVITSAGTGETSFSNSQDVPVCEIRSTPIYMPLVHHPSATPSSQRSLVPRTPSPNPSTLTVQQPHSALTSTSSLNRPPCTPGDSTNGNSTQYSTPSSLRPDSICSFPDSSPLMAPNVLAAADARLKESTRQKTLASQGSSSSLGRPVRPHQQHSGLSHGSSSSHAPSSSASTAVTLPTIITHHDVLQNSEKIQSREQLFDALNAGDDEDEGHDHHHLAHPNPGFARGQRKVSSSSKSSLRRSSSSSFRSGSGIELNTKVQRPTPAKLAGSDIETGGRPFMDQKNHREVVSAAMITRDSKENYSTLDSTVDLSSSPSYAKTSHWLESKRRTNRKWRRACCAVGLLVLLAVIAGISIGFVSRKNKVDGLAPPPTQEKPSTIKPPITQFPPNPNLHKSFYGLDYNPAKTIMPWCGANLQDVINDINVISQLTNRVRLYGMDCAQADLTFQAINLLNLNATMKVVLTIWVDKNATTYQRQYDTLFKVLDTYGTSMVQGISVGNEAIFRKDVTLKDLGARMATVRSNIKTRYNANIPIFTSEIGNNLNSTLADISDELSGNLHPYFAGVDVKTAAEWTFSQYNNSIVDNPTPTGLAGTISEVGWPSAPSTAINSPSAVPGLANLQTMVDTFICQANAAKMPYYWFEYKDEPWKNDPTVPVEPNWGLFDKNGNLKVKIPDCPAP